MGKYGLFDGGAFGRFRLELHEIKDFANLVADLEVQIPYPLCGVRLGGRGSPGGVWPGSQRHLDPDSRCAVFGPAVGSSAADGR